VFLFQIQSFFCEKVSNKNIQLTTAISLLVEIDDTGRFGNADHLASFIGWMPMYHSSGEKDGDSDITIRKYAALRCCERGEWDIPGIF
jgi:transposase